MRIFLTLLRRELGGYFASFSGYVVIASVQLLLGLSFYSLVSVLNQEGSETPLAEFFYETLYFWLILLMATPVITMRTFALEKYSGTYETLMTAPVGDVPVVLAKFLGALGFYMVMWTPLFGCLWVIRQLTGDPTALESGTAAGTVLGILLLGCVYISLGCFASSLTHSQIIAAMTSFAVGVGLYLLSFLAPSVSTLPGWFPKVLKQMSMMEHMREFVRGVVDTRHVVYYLSITVFFLFLNCKAVESRRWK